MLVGTWVVLARSAARAVGRLRTRSVWDFCLISQRFANDLRRQPAIDACPARCFDRIPRMEAHALFRQHRSTADRGADARPGPERCQFSGVRVPAVHACVPLRIRRRSVRRSAGDSTRPARDGGAVWIVGRVGDMESAATVARLISPVETQLAISTLPETGQAPSLRGKMTAYDIWQGLTPHEHCDPDFNIKDHLCNSHRAAA